MIEVPIGSKISTVTRGAINELIVAADLMAKGYSVFRSYSAHCPCDMVVMSDKKLWRVEVKSVTDVDNVTDSKLEGIGESFDVFAAVENCDRIRYIGFPEQARERPT